MLNDSSRIARVYTHSSPVPGHAFLRATIKEILHCAVGEMLNSEGGGSSTQDLDSAGAQGRFFVWTPDELRGVLGATVDAFTLTRYGITSIRTAHGFDGRNSLEFVDAMAQRPALAEGCRKLFEGREKRVTLAAVRSARFQAPDGGHRVAETGRLHRRVAPCRHDPPGPGTNPVNDDPVPAGPWAVAPGSPGATSHRVGPFRRATSGSTPATRVSRDSMPMITSQRFRLRSPGIINWVEGYPRGNDHALLGSLGYPSPPPGGGALRRPDMNA